MTEHELIVSHAAHVEMSAMARGMPALNSKVRYLVGLLSYRGFTTEMSGDLEGDMLVYVDLHTQHIDAISHVHLPRLWRVTYNTVAHTHLCLFGCDPVSLKQPNVSATEPTLTRLCRHGGSAVTEKEAHLLVDALSNARDRVANNPMTTLP